MRADDIRLLFDYSYSATRRVLDAADRLDGDAFTAVPPIGGCPSPRAVLVHMLDAEQSWRRTLRRGAHIPEPDLDPNSFPTVAALADAWHADEQEMRDWLATLDDDALNAPVLGGRPLWQYLLHVCNHGTQHRSEAALILTHLGTSPGDLDFTFYLRDWSDD